MKYLKHLLVVLSLIVGLWLLFDSIDDIGIAETKNNHLVRERVFKVIEYNNTDSLKARTNLYLDGLKKVRQMKSNEAVNKMRFIVVLVVMQFLLFISILRRR
jgi:hypothetical protein